jgi:hypothetical protein
MTTDRAQDLRREAVLKERVAAHDKNGPFDPGQVEHEPDRRWWDTIQELRDEVARLRGQLVAAEALLDNAYSLDGVQDCEPMWCDDYDAYRAKYRTEGQERTGH